MNKPNNEELQAKHQTEWIKASYETMGWEKPVLSDKDFERIDIECGLRETSTGVANPPWFYEMQIAKAAVSTHQAQLAKCQAQPDEKLVEMIANILISVWNHPPSQEWREQIASQIVDAVTAHYEAKVAEAEKAERERIKNLLRDGELLCPDTCQCESCKTFWQALQGE